MINTLRDKYKYKCNIGYSGHEVDLAVSNAAAAMGISSLDTHITLERSTKVLDQQIDTTIQSISVNEVNHMLKKIDDLDNQKEWVDWISKYGDDISKQLKFVNKI